MILYKNTLSVITYSGNFYLNIPELWLKCWSVFSRGVTWIRTPPKISELYCLNFDGRTDTCQNYLCWVMCPNLSFGMIFGGKSECPHRSFGLSEKSDGYGQCTNLTKISETAKIAKNYNKKLFLILRNGSNISIPIQILTFVIRWKIAFFSNLLHIFDKFPNLIVMPVHPSVRIYLSEQNFPLWHLCPKHRLKSLR